jgi:hypothetical protein
MTRRLGTGQGNAYKVSAGNLKQKNHVGQLAIDERTLLKWILKTVAVD